MDHLLAQAEVSLPAPPLAAPCIPNQKKNGLTFALALAEAAHAAELLQIVGAGPELRATAARLLESSRRASRCAQLGAAKVFAVVAQLKPRLVLADDGMSDEPIRVARGLVCPATVDLSEPEKHTVRFLADEL